MAKAVIATGPLEHKGHEAAFWWGDAWPAPPFLTSCGCWLLKRKFARSVKTLRSGQHPVGHFQSPVSCVSQDKIVGGYDDCGPF